MYAIVDIAGEQLKVEKDQKLFVNRLNGKAGEKLNFGKVLLLDKEGNTTIGSPVVEGASVDVEVVKHLQGDKVIVFKKKRRKGYVVKNGHRQALSEIKITGINS